MFPNFEVAIEDGPKITKILYIWLEFFYIDLWSYIVGSGLLDKLCLRLSMHNTNTPITTYV